MEKKIHLKFYPNPTRPTSKGELPIYLRITVNRIKAEIATGVSCLPDAWDVENERIKAKPSLNQVINDLSVKTNKIIKRLEVEEKVITANSLKNLIQGNQVSKQTLLSYADYYYKKFVLNNSEMADGTKRIYKTSYYLHLTNYLEYKQNQNLANQEDKISKNIIKNSDGKSDIFLINCDLEFITDYSYWMIHVEKKDRNTAANHHKKLCSLFKQTVIEKELNTNPCYGFKVKKKKTYIHKLEREQLDILETHSLADNKSLDEVRDCFIFSCYTGLRISHALSLRKENIIIKDKRFWIQTKEEQSKTKDPLLRPLLDKAKKIIDKYKDTQAITGFILPIRNKVKINLYLKVIQDLTSIDVGEPLHFHHARHTFATLICIENDIPLEATMKFLNHSDIRSTMVYAEIRQQMLVKYAKQMNKSNALNDKKRNKKTK
jgi:integrase